jgi:sugar phosphate isomerase/epimerase
MIKAAGFEGIFSDWSEPGCLDDVAKTAKEEGMIFQSIHAPFKRVADIWHRDAEKAKVATDELIACLDDCKRLSVPIMVAHAFIGFKEHSPTKLGLTRFAKIVKAAEERGVKIAFENTEGEEYLDALMAQFKDNPFVGFCWDTGHEMCYNRHRDMLASYGDRLIATHINDNLGISRADGEIFWTDDLHLLPFDGIADWDGIAARLDKCGFNDIMTFELTILSKPNRHDNEKYADMHTVRYLAEAYARACRVAAKRKLKQA